MPKSTDRGLLHWLLRDRLNRLYERISFSRVADLNSLPRAHFEGAQIGGA